MVITSLKLRVLQNSVTKLKGIASIVLDNFVAINEIKILYNDGTFFLAMPSKQTKAGIYKDVAHPINAAGRKYIEDAVFYAYHKAVEMNGERVQMELQHFESSGALEFAAEKYEVQLMPDRVFTVEAPYAAGENKPEEKTEEHRAAILDSDWQKWFNN